jgi:hypothetical protein
MQAKRAGILMEAAQAVLERKLQMDGDRGKYQQGRYQRNYKSLLQGFL